MSRKASSRPARHTGKQKMTLVVLGVMALAIVFILPMLVTEPWFLGGDGDEPLVQDTSPTTVSPSTVAEKTKYRQDSQTVLAEIIAVRDRLLERNVETWAEADFNQALKAIEDGDERYSFGEYGDSLAIYRHALGQFKALEQRGTQRLETAISDGMGALESLNTVVAASATEMATMIAPQDPRVQQLAARNQTLPQMAEVMDRADQARARKDLQTARAAYQEAVQIDPQNRRAREALVSIGTDITESVFQGHMSRGYAALERNDYDLARSAFHEADTVHANNPAVAQALAQVGNEQSRASVNQRIDQALELESNEQWHEALTAYEALLAEDPTLTEVKAKLIPARVRADLDTRLVTVIDDPLQLSSQSGYREGQVLLSDARSIPNRGARLSSQVQELETLLVRATSAVDVVFQSDNITHVTLFRIKELGQFERTSMRLRPGRYVAGGTRKGFRDVRVEFIITGEPMDKPIVVRCEESI